MRVTALPTSLSAIGVLALVGAGCGPLDTWLDVQRHKGGTTTASPSGLAGMSGSGTGAGGSAVPGTTCVKIPDGGPTSCKPYDVWKQYGTDACAQQKMELTDLVGGTTCNGGYQDVTYVCCAAAPSGSTGSGGAGGGGTCTKIDEGGPDSCKPYDTWKQDGYDRCLQQNLLLTDLTLGPACDGGYQSMTFTCCGNSGTPTPTTPPPKCGQTTNASGEICKTCWDPVSGKEISNDCAPGSIGSGGAGGGQTCIAIDDGGPTSCKDAATWKRYGSDRCGQQNLALADLKLAVACEGGYSVVSYVCCGGGQMPPTP